MASSIPSGSDALRIVLLGNAKVGKSAAANVILGRETFRETETTECELQRGRVDDRNISIIDTPGINSATLSSEQLKTEMRRLFSLSDPGPHVFLLLIRVGNFTEDQRNTVEWIQENFGEEALKFTMMLFTGKEDLTSSQWLKFSEDVKKLEFVEKCGLGYFGINSKREVNPAQITKLLEKIETRIQQNGGKYFSKEMYEAFQKKILEEIEEEKRKKDKERKRQEEEEDQKLKMCTKEKEKEKEKEKLHRKNTEPILWTSVRDNKSPISSNPQDPRRRRRHTIENEGQRYSKEMYEELQKRLLKEFEEEKRKKDEERKGLKEEEDQKLKSSIKEKEKEKLHRKNTEPILWTSVRDNTIPISSNPQDPIRRRHTIDMIPEQSCPQIRTEDHQTRTQLETEMIRNPQRDSVTMERLSINEQEEWEKKGATGGAIPDPDCHIRIVLLGSAGSGKSATGNTILDQTAFGKNINSRAKCRKHNGWVENKIVTVIDTKGISHGADISLYKTLFEESLSMSTPGPHVFLLVIHSPTMLNNTMYPLINSLGPEFLKRALVLLTYGDIWGSDHRRVLNLNLELKRLVNRCGGDFQIFNNENKEDRTQVSDLLEKIQILVQKNGGRHYTNEMYLEAQRKMVEDRVEVLEERVDELARENEQLSTLIQQSQRKSSEKDGCCLL